MSDDSQIALQRAVGGRIRALRVERDLTQGECAQKAGMTEQHVWRIEAGRQNVSLRSLARLAVALGVPMSTLLEGVTPDSIIKGTRSYRRPSSEDDG